MHLCVVRIALPSGTSQSLQPTNSEYGRGARNQRQNKERTSAEQDSAHRTTQTVGPYNVVPTVFGLRVSAKKASSPSSYHHRDGERGADDATTGLEIDLKRSVGTRRLLWAGSIQELLNHLNKTIVDEDYDVPLWPCFQIDCSVFFFVFFFRRFPCRGSSSSLLPLVGGGVSRLLDRSYHSPVPSTPESDPPSFHPAGPAPPFPTIKTWGPSPPSPPPPSPPCDCCCCSSSSSCIWSGDLVSGGGCARAAPSFGSKRCGRGGLID